ncbi:MAG: T9SS type A sorting domain-containing protein [Bacteroidales bacterium]|nr:T9SS type A sorting domain-containing protein [Bacteroidales bacterium]
MRKFTKILQVMVILLLSSSLAFAQSFQAEKAEKVYVDKSPNSSNAVIPPSDVLFDLEFQFPPSGIAQAGIETDGIYIYTTEWNGSEFYRYRLDGTFVEAFTVEGAGWIRDLAYDGTYFYGSNATTAFGEMDFTPHNETLISLGTAPVAVRALAYDEDLDVFYANNWGSDISCFDRLGVEQYNFPVGPIADSFYGLAYDIYCGGPHPYLWGFAQVGATNNELIQIDLPTGAETGLTFDVGTLLGVTVEAIAGGLCIADNIVPGEWTLIGNCQGEWFWGLELCVPAPPAPALDMACAYIDAPSSGLLGSSEPVTITVFNKGSAAQSNIPVSYVFDGGSPVLETVPGPIPQNGYASYTFTTTLDCSIVGAHILMACTNLPSDADVSNDCLSKAIISIPSGDCQHQIDLYDDYGDGWNGGLLDVLVNGIIVLNDITLADGTGPATFYYYVSTGDVVTTVYTTGGWPYENWYEIYDDFGAFIIDDGIGGVDPAGITYNAVCAGCCDHQICLTDDYGDGWNGGSVDVYVNGSPVLTDITLAAGAGPECYTFNACNGSVIDVYYTSGDGSHENWYGVYDFGGVLLGESGTGGITPIDLLGLTGNCSPPPPPPTYCEYEVCLTDDYGDGWNGGVLDVLINGSVYYDDLTLASGAGPECHLIPVNSGDIISFDYTPGSWAYENEYYVYNSIGVEVAREGAGGVEPGNMADITAVCTCCEHSVVLTDDYGDGWNGGTMDILVNGTVVLDDIYCSGAGPIIFYFDACAGDDIDAAYTAGNWANEDAYQVFDGFGNLLGESGQGGVEPVDVLDMAGKCGACVADAGECATVYYGYEPAECTDLTVTVSNVTPPYSILWSTGETTETITVCPTVTTTYEVTVTDADGCVATDDVIVEVVDVRCGNKLRKVEVCHIPPGQVSITGEPEKSKTICIAAPAVLAHLLHGDHLGPCGIQPCDGFYTGIYSLKSTQLSITPVVDENDWNIYPNPAYDKAYIELSIFYDQEIQVTIFDMTGKAAWNHAPQILESHVLEVNLQDMPSGIYQVVLRTNDQTMFKKLVITK